MNTRADLIATIYLLCSLFLFWLMLLPSPHLLAISFIFVTVLLMAIYFQGRFS